jgi:hypothetical protein
MGWRLQNLLCCAPSSCRPRVMAMSRADYCGRIVTRLRLSHVGIRAITERCFFSLFVCCVFQHRERRPSTSPKELNSLTFVCCKRAISASPFGGSRAPHKLRIQTFALHRRSARSRYVPHRREYRMVSGSTPNVLSEGMICKLNSTSGIAMTELMKRG